MRARQFSGSSVMSMVVLLLVAAFAPAAGAEGSFAPLVGTWVGPVAWPSGSSEITVWTIGVDGTFSVQTDEYTALGSLQPRGADYAFTYERGGQTYTGTLAAQDSNGRHRLIGRGEDAHGGPMDITLTQH